MEVSAFTSLSQATAGTQQQTAAAGSKDEFLRLLVAQLQHQDPLAPQDGAQFVAQLAQFATLEQSAETNARLGSIEAGQASSVRAGFTNLVGRNVSAKSNSYDLPASADVAHQIHLSANASAVDVVIYDSTGKEVRRLPQGAQAKGDVSYLWDGLDKDGATMPEGKYTVAVEAKDSAGAALDAYSLIRGLVSAVEFGEDGTVTFRVGPASITPADIISIER